MRIVTLLALLAAVGSPAAFAQTPGATPACLKQMNLSFYAVSETARYGLLFEVGTAADTEVMVASWTAGGKLRRTALRSEGGRILPLGDGFRQGEQLVRVSLAQCGPVAPAARLIRLDRKSPDHGHRRMLPRLDLTPVRPIL